MEHAQPSPVVNTEPDQADTVDLAIGVVTAGASPAVERLAAVVREGLEAHFGGRTAALIHVDQALSEDRQGGVEPIAEAIRLVHVRPAHAPAEGDMAGAWSESVHTVLATGRWLKAQALVLLNADLSSTTPDWIGALAGPVLKEGCALVLPVYRRGRYEGTLTQTLVVPLVRALFGRRFQHPMAEEFACSAEAADFILEQDVWNSDLARQGLEFWLPVGVSERGLSVVQSVLGPRTLSTQGTPAPLGPTVGRVAGALFAIAERHEAAWLDVRGSEPVPVFGEAPPPVVGATAIDPERMLTGFLQGVRDLLPIWDRILSPESLGDVLALSAQVAVEFRFPDRLWARVVYDFLLAYRARVMYRSHITRSLAPLYLGRAASLVLETRLRAEGAVALALERQARVFESDKAYLVDRWR